MRRGYTLLEILVVLGIFVVLAIISVDALFLSIRNVRKSEAISKVRENVNFAISIMERHLRNATNASCVSFPPSSVSFIDPDGKANSFSCLTDATDGEGYIASGSANIRLTDKAIVVTTCSFTCNPPAGGAPPSVLINITAKDKNSNIEGSEIKTSSNIYFRTY